MTGLGAFRRSHVAGVLLTAACSLGATPAPGATLYGLIDTGELYDSTDDGLTWSPLSTLPVRDATALAARLSSSDLFLASRSGFVYRSLDAGATWAPAGAITATDLEDMTIRPDGTLLALTATGSLYSSSDLGATFTPLANLTGSNFVSLTHTTPAVKHYALTRTGEVYESADGGVGWTFRGVMPVSDALRIRALHSTLYVLTETGDTFRSTDGGASWTAVGTLSQVGMRGLVRNGSALAAATREGHVATSADGASWTWRGSMNQLSLTALASNEPATTGVPPEQVTVAQLEPPYPNPSAGVVSFALRLERGADVSLGLYDLAGRMVASRIPGRYGAGHHVVTWDPGVTTPGLYFLRMETSIGAAVERRWVVRQ